MPQLRYLFVLQTEKVIAGKDDLAPCGRKAQQLPGVNSARSPSDLDKLTLRGRSVGRRALPRAGCLAAAGGQKTSYRTRIRGLNFLPATEVLIFADQDALLPTGSRNWKTAPRGVLGVAQMRPPWDSMIDRLMASPIPMPPGLVV